MFGFRLVLVCICCVDTAKSRPKLAVANWFTHKTLGVGVHANPQLKHAAAKALVNFRSLIREKVIIKGAQWKEKFSGDRSVIECIGFLFGISYMTIQRSVTFLKERSAHATLPDPATRGRKKMTREEYQQAYGTVYNAVLEYLKAAKKNGETVQVDKLLLHLREEEPGGRESMDMALDTLRYYLTRMGFKHGRISRVLTCSRNKDYIIAWLIAYCQRRTKFATDPTEDMLHEVHFYVDESFLYRNDAGKFSWFCPGDQHQWAKPTGTKQRWGIVHGIFDWYEPIDEGDPAPPQRKRRKKNSSSDPKPPEGYVRKMETFMETLKVWSCAGEGNMDTDKFLEWLHVVCKYFQSEWDEEDVLVIHLDNASYHKTKNPKFFDVDAKNAER